MGFRGANRVDITLARSDLLEVFVVLLLKQVLIPHFRNDGKLVANELLLLWEAFERLSATVSGLGSQVPKLTELPHQAGLILVE